MDKPGHLQDIVGQIHFPASAPHASALHGLQIFLGTLREAEVERVNQRISQAIIETCLAMTIFRDEFNVKFVALFTVLSFIKVFHWLVQDRCAPITMLVCPCNPVQKSNYAVKSAALPAAPQDLTDHCFPSMRRQLHVQG